MDKVKSRKEKRKSNNLRADNALEESPLRREALRLAPVAGAAGLSIEQGLG
ncbi:MAG: hypothetical protein ABSH16_06480 [Sedimentisphaerales bacterium]